MKKEFLVAVSVLFGMAASLSVSAQEKPQPETMP